MKLRSSKAKGRRCAVETKDILVKYAPHLENDIIIPVGTVPGADLILSPKALETYPFSFECKNVEKIAIWEALRQSEGHAKANETPLLVFKKNHTPQYVALRFEAFLQLISAHR